MSFLSTFTGSPAGNYLRFRRVSRVSGSPGSAIGIPQFFGTTGIAAYGGNGTYNNNSSDNNSGTTTIIYPVWADTIQAQYNIRVNGAGASFRILGSPPTLCATAGHFMVHLASGAQVYIAEGTGNPDFTDLSIEVDIQNGACKFDADPFGGNNGYTSNLANITFKSNYLYPTGASTIKLQDLALTAQSVESILVGLDGALYSSLNNLSVNLSGGTSSGASALTAAASAARTSLLAKGIGSITLNP